MVKAVSVSQLNGYINRILSTDPILVNVSVVGELTNLTRHSSGHWYFSLKDDKSTVRCFLARDRVSKLRFELEEGMKLTVWGSVSVYERGGSYSLNIRDVETLGEGDLKKAFDLLVKKLQSEGIFDEEHKKAIPEFPKKIGVVTSPTGAAIRDIITTIKRRNPLVDLILYPCLVQGTDAASDIAKGIKTFNSKFKDIDVLIVGRGGGSAEDLWAFNEEAVARAIYDSSIPVISAVGHEVDTVISDFAADLRAATPTAAAELAVPDIEYYIDIINSASPQRLFSALYSRYEDALMLINHLHDMCKASIDSKLSDARHVLSVLKLDIDSRNPMIQLDRGYAIAKNIDGKWIASSGDITTDSEFNLLLKDGTVRCIAKEIIPNGN